METKKVISLEEARELRVKRLEKDDQDFQVLFTKARELRFENFKREEEDITVLDWNGVRDFFQSELSREVFRQKLFSRNILMSIWFVSDLLTSYMKGDLLEIGVANHLSSYADKGDSKHLLMAANSAFLFFVFWPETRHHRSLQYQKHGAEYGPSLYSQYGSVSRKAFGFHMANAFEPIGEIARERFS